MIEHGDNYFARGIEALAIPASAAARGQQRLLPGQLSVYLLLRDGTYLEAAIVVE